MFTRNWKIIAGVIAIALLASGILYGLGSQQGYADRANESSAYFAKHAPNKATKACLNSGNGAAEKATCLREAAAEHRVATQDKQREYEDLIAQQKSALWTMIMGVAALIGMALSVVGIVLVYLTFSEQKAANEVARQEATAAANEATKALLIAEKNAAAAAEQVRISQEISRTTLRAYVTPGAAEVEALSPGIGQPITQWEITIPWHNTGRTPALKGQQIIESDPPPPALARKEMAEVGDIVIGAGLIARALPRSISAYTLKAIYEKRYPLILKFRFLYDDIYSASEPDAPRRVSEVAWRVECRADPDGAVAPNPDFFRFVYVEGSSVQT